MKFRGSSGDKKKADGTQPISAASLGATGSSEGKKLFPKATLKSGKAQSTEDKKKKLIMLGAAGLGALVVIFVAYYFLISIPAKKKAEAVQLAQMEEKKRLDEEKRKQEEIEKVEKEKRRLSAARGGLIIETEPRGATVIVSDETPAKTPASFKALKLGKHPVKISMDGYEPLVVEVEIEENRVTDKGVYKLTPSLGSLQISAVQNDVEVSLTHQTGTTKTAKLPVLLSDIPVGSYQVKARYKDFEIVDQIVVKRKETVTKKLDFQLGKVVIQSSPAGATVTYQGKKLGVTPLTIPEVKAGAVEFSLSLDKYKTITLTGVVSANHETTLSAELDINRDITASIGMEMVWVKAGYWVGKYEVTQEEYTKVMGQTSSSFRGLRRPVEMVTWEEAVAFCEKLTEIERAAGKLPQGFIYSLPREIQWDYYVGDATPEEAVVAWNQSQSGTSVVGSGKPNQFGLYDVVGNVWEWCLDDFDGTGEVKASRGGCWLSTKANFPDISVRGKGRLGYRDRFTGFRCILVKPSS